MHEEHKHKRHGWHKVHISLPIALIIITTVSAFAAGGVYHTVSRLQNGQQYTVGFMESNAAACTVNSLAFSPNPVNSGVATALYWTSSGATTMTGQCSDACGWISGNIDLTPRGVASGSFAPFTSTCVGTNKVTCTVTGNSGTASSCSGTAYLSVNPLPVSNSPVAYWKFDEGSGLTALDSSGRGLNGTLVNGPLWVAGNSRTALNFDGVNDYIAVPSSGWLALTGDMTIVAWVKATDFANFNGILSKTKGNIPAPYDFYLLPATGKPRFLRGNGTNFGFADGTAAPALGKWQLIVVTQSGGIVTHYLNGVANGTGAINVVPADFGYAVRIGSREDGATKMKGALDGVRVWNRALSASEVANLYYVEGPIQPVVPTVTVTAPNTAVAWDASTTQSITWTSGGAPANATAYITLLSGTSSLVIASAIPNTGSYSWKIPHDCYLSVKNICTDVSKIQVVLKDPATSQVVATDASDANFIIQLRYILYKFIPGEAVSVTADTNVQSVPGGGTMLGTVKSGSLGIVANYAQYAGGKWWWPVVSITPIGWIPESNLKLVKFLPGMPVVANTDTYLRNTPDSDGFILLTVPKGMTGFIPKLPMAVANMVAQWQSNEGSGLIALDTSGNGFKGTLVNGPVWVAGKSGSALNFDGTNDYVNVPSAASLALTGDMTITAWVKATDFANFNSILSKTNGNKPAPYDFYFLPTSGKPRFYRGNGTTAGFADGTTAPALNQWQFIAVTQSGVTVTHYLNGAPNGMGAISVTPADAGHAVRIGMREDGNTKMKGAMDDVRIYNRALSASEIKAVYGELSTGMTTQGGGFSPLYPTIQEVSCGGFPCGGGGDKWGDHTCWLDPKTNTFVCGFVGDSNTSPDAGGSGQLPPIPIGGTVVGCFEKGECGTVQLFPEEPDMSMFGPPWNPFDDYIGSIFQHQTERIDWSNVFAIGTALSIDQWLKDHGIKVNVWSTPCGEDQYGLPKSCTSAGITGSCGITLDSSTKFPFISAQVRTCSFP